MLANALLLIPLAFSVAAAAATEFKAEDATFENTTLETKVVGGTPARANEFPFFVRLIIENRQGGPGSARLCGGAVIDMNWVVTAAHCVDNRRPNDITAEINLDDLNNPSQNFQSRQADRIVLHSRWDSGQLENDIALIRVERPFDLDRRSSGQVALPSSDFDCSGDATFLGNGPTSSTGGSSNSDRLMKVQLPIRTSEQCRADLDDRFQSSSMLCAGRVTGGVGPCPGDNGGPLFIPTGNWRVLCGISSWNNKCGRVGSPAVFTRVKKYVQWIVRATASQNGNSNNNSNNNGNSNSNSNSNNNQPNNNNNNDN